MAAEEDLPPDLREEMLKLESSLEAFGDLLKQLTKQPLLDTKNKVGWLDFHCLLNHFYIVSEELSLQFYLI